MNVVEVLPAYDSEQWRLSHQTHLCACRCSLGNPQVKHFSVRSAAVLRQKHSLHFYIILFLSKA